MISRRTKTTALTSLFMCAAALAALALLLHVMSLKKGATEERAAAWAAAEVRRDQLASLSMLVADTAPDRERIEAFVLKEESVIDFLSDMDRTARSKNLIAVTTALNVEPIANTSSFESLSLSMELTGELSDLTSMIVLFETLPVQLTIRRVSLNKIGGQEELGVQWRANIDMLVTKFKQ